MARTVKEPKLPVKQLTILCICRFAEPIALSSVFPYLPEMIENFKVPKNEVAKWAGITSAVFSLSQCLTAIAWGRASDRFGRKPVILFGLSCTVVASTLFGFARSLPWAISARAMAGASAGTVGIFRTTVAEMVPQKILQPRAFSVMPLIWTIGSIVGPMLGGALAKPAAKYPQLFGNNTLFKMFPFALPNLVAGLFFLIGISTGFLFLHETLETKKGRRDWGRSLGKAFTGVLRKEKKSKWRMDNEQTASLLKHSRISSASSMNDYGGDDDPPKNAVSQAPPSYREVFSPQSNINLLAYSLLALHSVAFDQLVPVFLHLPPQPDRSFNPNVRLPFKFAGGFGLDSGRIGIIFTLYGVIGVIFQFLVFPPVARRYGVLNCLKVCTLVFPVAYLLAPFTVLLPTPLLQQVGILMVMIMKSSAGVFAFPCTTILLTNSARSLRLLGTLNGVATSLSAIGRAIGPSIGGTAFTFGIDVGYVVIPWWILAAFAALGNVPVWWLIEMDGFGGSGESDSDEDDDDDEEIESLVLRSPVAGDEDFQSSGAEAENQGSVTKVNKDNQDESAIEDDPLETLPLISPKNMRQRRSHSAAPRMTLPIGMADGIGPGGRRYSNGLGQTMTGLGTGRNF